MNPELNIENISYISAVMVFAVVEKAGTVVMNDQEELDSWSVIINGEVRIDREGKDGQNVVEYLKCGDSFGITSTMDKMLHSGVMKTVQDDCQFVCITQTDYYKILNDGETNQMRYEDENGDVVLVTETENSSKEQGHKIIRGTEQKLLEQLTEDTPSISGEPIHSSNAINDPSYVEDFLLTHRTFISSTKVMEHLLSLMHKGNALDTEKQRVTRVILLWVCTRLYASILLVQQIILVRDF